MKRGRGGPGEPGDPQTYRPFPVVEIFEDREWAGDMSNGFKYIMEDATPRLYGPFSPRINSVFDTTNKPPYIASLTALQPLYMGYVKGRRIAGD
jgi:hypothetical protein